MSSSYDLQILNAFLNNSKLLNESSTLSSLLSAANKSDLHFKNEEQLREALCLLSCWSFPNWITDFVHSFFENKKFKLILDYKVTSGELIAELSKKFHPEFAAASCSDEKLFWLYKLLDEQDIHWSLEGNEEISQNKFDLVVCYPTWGLISTKKERDLILEAAAHIGEQGSLLFLVPTSFFWKYENAERELNQKGIFVRAIFHLPRNSVSQTSSIPTLLVFCDRNKVMETFVGELTSEESRPKALLKNFEKKICGKTPQLGIWIESATFRSFDKLIEIHEFEMFEKQSGFAGKELKEITLEINRGKQNLNNGGFEEHPNCVYLPIIGTSPAINSLADISIKPHNYIQLVLDKEQCDSNYLISYLNAPIGRKLRSAITSGIFIPKISLTSIQKMRVHIPSPERQLEIASVNRAITDVTTNLNSLSRQLWEKPRSLPEIKRSLKPLLRENDLILWMETLPFPIGSILWRYEAAAGTKEKVEALFHFYEGLAQFIATILLSFICSDTEYFKENASKFFDGGESKWRLHPSFGNWIILGERISKDTRRQLSTIEEREKCLQRFEPFDEEYLQLFTDKKLFAELKTASEYRNDWKGHGGVVGPEQASKLLELLRINLSAIRECFSDRFEQVQLIRPLSSKYSEDGTYTYQVHSITGRTGTFKELTVETIKPMAENSLYLLKAESFLPIKLLPFIKMLESPKTQQNACYFYNRLEGKEFRWISYHFEKEAELRGSESEFQITTALELLKTN